MSVRLRHLTPYVGEPRACKREVTFPVSRRCQNPAAWLFQVERRLRSGKRTLVSRPVCAACADVIREIYRESLIDPGSRDHRDLIVRNCDRIIAEIEQIIRDGNYWNGLPQNQQYTPYDLEPDRLLLARMKAEREKFVSENP